MNTIENKCYLWDTLVEQEKFKEEISVEKTRKFFEHVLNEFDALEMSLEEKNNLFLETWVKRLEEVFREQWFEERITQKQYKKPPSANELTEIKKLLYKILDLLE